MAQRVLIDCDPGMDDAVALLLAIASDDLQIDAITAATGNLTADRTSENARKVLDLAGAGDIPVAQGPIRPLVRAYPRDPFSHGDDGLGGTNLPASRRALDRRSAPQAIIDVVRSHPGEVTIIATAPLTNVALALLQAADIAQHVNRLVAIAGAFGFNDYATRYATGDNPVSEWNVRVDPEAARIVFRSGMPILALGVDVWGRPTLNFSAAHIDRLRRSGTDAARFAATLAAYVEGRGYGTYTMHIDAMAVAAVLDPTLFRTERVRVDVETAGELTVGQTVVDRRVHHSWSHLPTIDAAFDVDAERYLELLVGSLAGARATAP
jgi:purine nucleosidase/pyrimidine-specific ribonucleoside hydrolase